MKIKLKNYTRRDIQSELLDISKFIKSNVSLLMRTSLNFHQAIEMLKENTKINHKEHPLYKEILSILDNLNEGEIIK